MSINLHQNFFLGPALSTYVIRLAENSISKFCSIYRYNTWPRASWSIEIAGKFRKYPCTSVTQYLWIIISVVPCLSVRVLAPAINSSYKIWHGEHSKSPVRESWKQRCNKCARQSSQDLTPQLRPQQPYPTTSGSHWDSFFVFTSYFWSPRARNVTGGDVSPCTCSKLFKCINHTGVYLDDCVLSVFCVVFWIVSIILYVHSQQISVVSHLEISHYAHVMQFW